MFSLPKASASSTGDHFGTLDGMRGLAILLVVAHHSLGHIPFSLPFSYWLSQICYTFYIGVPIFFVLSGFVISYPFFKHKLTDSKDWMPRQYIRRRLAKILPPFYLSILLFTVFHQATANNPAVISAGCLWAVGIPNFVFNFDAFVFNTVYWSLMLEVQFYLVLPAVFWLCRPLKFHATSLVIFLSFLIIPLLARLLTYDPHAEHMKQWFLANRFPGGLDSFLLGLLFAYGFVIVRAKQLLFKNWGRIGYLGIGMLALTMLTIIGCHFKTQPPTFWVGEAVRQMPNVAAFFMLFFLFDPQLVGSRIFNSTWLSFIGIISYDGFCSTCPSCNISPSFRS
jgi:peptidoglycan/LPS O-acetylase OafA/YrhL